jgi:multiple sugar transport system substrate-binding protein
MERSGDGSMTRWTRRSFAAAGAALGAGGLLAACGGSPGSADTTDAREKAGDGTGKVVFWAWAAGLDGIVEHFNSIQSDITVELSSGTSGDEAYKKLQTSVDSGTGPDLAQVEYSQIPSLAISGTLQDVSALDARYADRYQTANWELAGFKGGRHYGIPNDQGPLVMYYNEDLLQSVGLDVPESWEEYRAAAEVLKDATGARMGTLLQAAPFIAGLAQQAGAQWFDIDGDSWVVTVDDDATRQALDFWIDLADDGLVSVDPGFNTGYWQELDAQNCATNLVGLWGYRGMKGNLERTIGQWRAADCPQWSSDAPVGGNHGGSVWAVTRSSTNIAAALTFADWLAADPASMNLQYDSSGYYPAAADPSAVGGYSQPDEFFGGQEMLTTFEQAGDAVRPGWVWGPQMSELTGMLEDRLMDAVRAGSSEDYLRGIQKDFVGSLRARGLSVKEGR